MENTEKPFSRAYVLNVTLTHVRRSIDISIEKTVARIGEFADNQEKSQEVLMTLSDLYSMRKMNDDFCAIKLKEE